MSTCVVPADPGARTAEWETELNRWLARLGHRNWVVIADAAYPLHSNGGVTTRVLGEDHLQVLARTLGAIDECRHIRADVYTDAELQFVPEEDAPGVSEYRGRLSRLIRGRNTCELDHERIIAKLDGCAKLFHVLVLKTTLTIPYTSVFLELQCAYWDAAAERRLRQRGEAGP